MERLNKTIHGKLGNPDALAGPSRPQTADAQRFRPISLLDLRVDLNFSLWVPAQPDPNVLAPLTDEDTREKFDRGKQYLDERWMALNHSRQQQMSHIEQMKRVLQTLKSEKMFSHESSKLSILHGSKSNKAFNQDDPPDRKPAVLRFSGGENNFAVQTLWC